MNGQNPIKEKGEGTIMTDDELTRLIIGCAMKVHRTLGSGFLESVYQNALAFELKRAEISFACEVPLKVYYEGEVMGTFVVDMLAEDHVIIENKAVENLCPAHEAQLVNYLAATHNDFGLLLNFGTSSLQFKKKFRIYRAPESQL
ncbi:MAG: GxxExxY protein [Kiritimatiellae bacterium]|nr:GxxExxY protein [Kiritimatiellia bacterium]